MLNFLKKHRSDLVMIALFSLACVALLFVDFAPKVARQEPGEKVKARVLEVDNSYVRYLGLVGSGFQVMELEILGGSRKGEVFTAQNMLRSQLDLDKIFSPGDTVLAGIRAGARPGEDMVNAQDFYRTDWTIWLFLLFALLLVAFGGFTGFKALLSFVFACLVIWKVQIPLCLMGWNPIAVSLGIVVLLTAAIIFIVAGLTRRGTVAFVGGISGVAASCAMAFVFTHLFKINGASMPYSQALLYSGYETLNLTDIYIGAVFLAASGALMDLAMDVSAGMDEVLKANPAISRRQLVASGLSIGRSVVGTMTTTLLLAYSGGYLTLMMMFTAQGTRFEDFINNPYVAAELVKTIIGSFGLVLVAPLSALAGGVIFKPRR